MLRFSSFRIRNGFGHLVKLNAVSKVFPGGYRWWEAICEQYKNLKTATLEIFMPSKWCMFFFGRIDIKTSEVTTKTQTVVDFIKLP